MLGGAEKFAGFAIAGEVDRESRGGEVTFQGFAQQGVVFDDQDADDALLGNEKTTVGRINLLQFAGNGSRLHH